MCNLISVKIQLFCEALRGLLENLRTNSIMKAKKHTRQVRDKVVEKFKARLGYKKNPKLCTSHGALSNPSSESGKSMAQLQTYHDMAVNLN